MPKNCQNTHFSKHIRFIFSPFHVFQFFVHTLNIISLLAMCYNTLRSFLHILLRVGLKPITGRVWPVCPGCPPMISINEKWMYILSIHYCSFWIFECCVKLHARRLSWFVRLYSVIFRIETSEFCVFTLKAQNIGNNKHRISLFISVPKLFIADIPTIDITLHEILSGVKFGFYIPIAGLKLKIFNGVKFLFSVTVEFVRMQWLPKLKWF